MKTRSSSSLVLITWILIILFAGTIAYYFISKESYIPADFSTARIESANLANELVSLLDTSLKNLDKISDEDKKGNYSLALDMVKVESDNVTAARNKAVELAAKLEIMAKAVQDIRPEKSKNLALEAVTKEVSLLSHLLNYNTYFNDLLRNLKMKFTGDDSYTGDDIATSIMKMNIEAQEINSINNEFNNKLAEFDASIK